MNKKTIALKLTLAVCTATMTLSLADVTMVSAASLRHGELSSRVENIFSGNKKSDDDEINVEVKNDGAENAGNNGVSVSTNDKITVDLDNVDVNVDIDILSKAGSTDEDKQESVENATSALARIGKRIEERKSNKDEAKKENVNKEEVKETVEEVISAIEQSDLELPNVTIEINKKDSTNPGSLSKATENKKSNNESANNATAGNKSVVSNSSSKASSGNETENLENAAATLVIEEEEIPLAAVEQEKEEHHNYVTEITKPGFFKDGVRIVYCTECGDVQSEEPIRAEGTIPSAVALLFSGLVAFFIKRG